MDSTTKIKPLPGWVLIDPITDEQETASGIRLPESAQDVPMKGKIIAQGSWTKEWLETISDPFGLVDETVLFKKYSGQTIKHEGKELKLVEFKDLLAVIE